MSTSTNVTKEPAKTVNLISLIQPDSLTGLARSFLHTLAFCLSLALLSALHVSWSWGIRIDQAVLKSETPDCQYSIDPCLESAGILNTAP